MNDRCGNCRGGAMCRAGCMLKKVGKAIMGDKKSPADLRSEMKVAKGGKSVAERINLGGRY